MNIIRNRNRNRNFNKLNLIIMKSNVTKTEKKETKNVILESKKLLNDNQIIESSENLDDVNFENLLITLSKNIKQTSNTKEKMYKIEVDKKIRQSLRKKRNKFFDNIIFFASNNLKEDLKKEINLFDKFYKETYLLNDYSLNSIVQNNSDDDTKLKCKLVIEIIKRNK